MTHIAVLLLCAAAICKVGGFPYSVDLAVAAMIVAGVRGAWMFFDGAFQRVEDVNEPGRMP